MKPLHSTGLCHLTCATNPACGMGDCADVADPSARVGHAACGMGDCADREADSSLTCQRDDCPTLRLANGWRRVECACGRSIGIGETGSGSPSSPPPRTLAGIAGLAARTPVRVHMFIQAELDERLARELTRQDVVSTYGTDRDGVRLALACLQDELDEVLEAFQAEKRPIDGRTWAGVQAEAVQLVAIGLRLLRDLCCGAEAER